MSTPAKLRIAPGEDNYVELTCPSGIPDSLDSLKLEIRKLCRAEVDFRLQYMDDFDQFMRLFMPFIQDMPFIAEFIRRWCALFCEHEASLNLHLSILS